MLHMHERRRPQVEHGEYKSPLVFEFVSLLVVLLLLDVNTTAGEDDLDDGEEVSVLIEFTMSKRPFKFLLSLLLLLLLCSWWLLAVRVVVVDVDDDDDGDRSVSMSVVVGLFVVDSSLFLFKFGDDKWVMTSFGGCCIMTLLEDDVAGAPGGVCFTSDITRDRLFLNQFYFN